MICIIALIVFGLLGIFSASHRIIAKEAFDCVFRRLTLRKCESGLDKRLKAQITGKLMKRLPTVGKLLYKYFEVVSWIFLILLLVSLFFSAKAGYNYAVYGNCNGEDSSEFCIFDPFATYDSPNGPDNVCTLTELPVNNKLSLSGDLDNRPSFGPNNASINIVVFGCFTCPNTKLAAPEIKKLFQQYGNDIKFTTMNFPIPKHQLSYETSMAGECVWQLNPENYWDFYFALLESPEELSINWLRKIAVDIGVNFVEFDECIVNDSIKAIVDNDQQIGINSHVYGTPTFFINGEPRVGITYFDEFEEIIAQQKSNI